MPALSIIIPVYNVEGYIDRCINSILNQSFSDWEAIFIDDGSTDKSGEICDKYSFIDDRIRVVHKKNGGVSSARNKGLDLAKGKYIGFVDPDDYINANMFKNLISGMENNKCQIGICNFYIMKNDVIQSKGNKSVEETLKYSSFNKIEIIKKIFDSPRTIYNSVWNKIFIREIIGELRFDEKLHVSEDNLFLYNYLLNIEKEIYIYEPLYNFVLREGSATRGKASSLIPCLDVRKRIWLSTIKDVPSLKKYSQADYLDDSLRMLKLLKDEKKEYTDIIRKHIQECISYNFMDFIKNNKISWKLKIIYIMISTYVYNI